MVGWDLNFFGSRKILDPHLFFGINGVITGMCCFSSHSLSLHSQGGMASQGRDRWDIGKESSCPCSLGVNPDPHQLLPPIRELLRSKSSPELPFLQADLQKHFNHGKTSGKHILGSISPWIGIPHPEQDEFNWSGLTKTGISSEHTQQSGSWKGKVLSREKSRVDVWSILFPALSQESCFSKPLCTRIPGSGPPSCQLSPWNLLG